MKKIKQVLFFIIITSLTNDLTGQLYEDYYGAGHQGGVSVSSSDNNNQQTSITGAVDDVSLSEASRFLAQATLGYNYDEIEDLAVIGYEQWLDQQIAIAPTDLYPLYYQTRGEVDQIMDFANHLSDVFTHVWYTEILAGSDPFRHRMAHAWSQILVANRNGMFNHDHAEQDLGNIGYYTLLYEHAFGNYRDMLMDMTLNPMMGLWLSSLHNRKENPAEMTLPDENYAREIMQLFSIGVVELNIDGTVKIGPDGVPVETYNIEDITEMAKVFTGLQMGRKADGTSYSWFVLGYPQWDMDHPMRVFQDEHDAGTKVMPDGTIIPAGQAGLVDIEMAVDHLFNHPNVGPFLARLMIQHLVKSNPSPAYIKRVAMVFNDNGSGVRGDLKAFTKAIFLDPEARECDYEDAPTNGKLIQPMQRFITMFKAFDVQTPSGRFWIKDITEFYPLGLQAFMASPSVFNFFIPEYAEEGNVAPQNLVSPEFQILDAVTSVAYINKIEDMLKISPFYNFTGSGNFPTINSNDAPYFNLSTEISIYQTNGIGALLDRLDVLLCRGQLSTNMRSIITNSINQAEQTIGAYSSDDAVRDAIYYIMISPDYLIQF